MTIIFVLAIIAACIGISSFINATSRVEIFSERDREYNMSHLSLLKKIDITIILKNMWAFCINAVTIIIAMTHYKNLYSSSLSNLLWTTLIVSVVMALIYTFFINKNKLSSVYEHIKNKWKKEKDFKLEHDEEVRVIKGIENVFDITYLIISYVILFIVIIF